MYVAKIPNKKTGRTYLQIVESYREHGKIRRRTVKPLGYLDELCAQYDDPMAYFQEEAKRMTEEKQAAQTAVALTIQPDATLELDEVLDESNRKNIGAAALSVVYHELEIDYFFNNRRRYTSAEFNHNSIFKHLVYSRILWPGSKRDAWHQKDRCFESMECSLDDIYRSLSFFTKYKDQFLAALHKRISKLYQRDTSVVYYDITNYYFEIDKEDELRKKGVSKEHRPDPIVQMGLFADEAGLPISYGLYAGNTNDSKTLPSMMGDLAYEFDIQNIIVVADKGMMSGTNLAHIRSHRNGYVISYSVRGASKAFQEYVLDEDGYIPWGRDARYKSRDQPRVIEVVDRKGDKIKRTINERQIVFYSRKYAEKAKHDRAKAVEKARMIAEHPALRAKATVKGAVKYLNTIRYDKQGEVISSSQEDMVFDEEKLAAEERLDGYYAIMTNVIGTNPGDPKIHGKSRYTKEGLFQLNRPVSDIDIITMYKGLWKIEESFKVTKSTLRSRPVYLSREEHIEAHFLICFTALTILRILEHKVQGTYGAARIAESLRKANGTYVEHGYYVFDYYDKVLKMIGEALDLDFSRKYLTKGDLRSMIAKTKKTD